MFSLKYEELRKRMITNDKGAVGESVTLPKNCSQSDKINYPQVRYKRK